MNEKNRTYLSGHTSRETAFLIEDYPYGRQLRCKKLVWLETNKKGEMRRVDQTQDPRNDRWNAPKKSTYSPFLILYIDHDEKDYLKSHSLRFYGEKEEVKATHKFIMDNNINLTELQKITFRKFFELSNITFLTYKYRGYQPETLIKVKEIIKENIIQIRANEFENLFDNLQEYPVKDISKEEEDAGSYFKSTVYIGIQNIMDNKPEPDTSPEPTTREKLQTEIMSNKIKTLEELTARRNELENPAPPTAPPVETKKDFFRDHIIITGLNDSQKEKIYENIENRFTPDQTEEQPNAPQEITDHQQLNFAN